MIICDRNHEGDPGPLYWCAVQTRSRCEKKLAAELTGKGVETYLPVVSEVHQWKDRRKRVEMPLFPGYVFARTRGTAAERLQILTSAGAVRVLGHGSAPEPVPESQILSIGQLLASGRPVVAHPYLAAGFPVRVISGPLCGVEGLLVRHRAGARVIVSVDLLSQSVAVEVGADDVAVIPFAAGCGRTPEIACIRT